MLFVAFAYDSGKREAKCPKDDDVETCIDLVPGELPRLLVQRVGDIAVCAKADWEKQWVYADFIYSKIDPKKPAQFLKRKFEPQCIGMLSKSSQCNNDSKIDRAKCPKWDRAATTSGGANTTQPKK